MPRSTLLELLRFWALSLMLSAVLAAAGERWPQPLPIQPLLVAALVLLPPAVVLLWLGLHWSLPGGRAGDGGESLHSEAGEF